MFFGLPFLVTRATTDSATTALLGRRCCHPGLMRPASQILSTSSGKARATMSPGSPSDTARACMQTLQVSALDRQNCIARHDNLTASNVMRAALHNSNCHFMLRKQSIGMQGLTVKPVLSFAGMNSNEKQQQC